MRRHARFPQLLTAAVLSIAAGALLRAQEAPGQDTGVPERGVARVSVMNGEVSIRRGDSGDWVAAIVNAPLMVEDRIATGAGARAEVQFDAANLIRIGANAEIRLAQLDYGHYTVQVAHGTVSFRVRRPSKVQVELDTPTVSVRPAHVGLYRVYVQGDGQTEITVRAGDVEIYTPKGSETLQAGQTMLARGNPADPEFRVVPAIALDEWDRWNEQRDKQLESSPSSRNVPQDVYGAEDLDSYGRWVDVPEYGQVWSPSVSPDWAPYQDGRWVWEDWYGWTWVSYDPWGWAPFHWGRWFYSAPYGWCWYPGGFGHHYWAPGLVAFFGFGGGGGFGFGFGFGSIGWVPLAPFEALHPWWGRGYYGGFNHGVNVTSVNITNVYRNARVRNAVSGINAADFHQGRFSGITHVSAEQIRGAGLVRGQLPVAPGAGNLRYSNRQVASIPRSSENVRFFSRTQPAPVSRVPFAEQQRAMQQVSRQPVSPGVRGSGAPASTAGAGGWRRLDGSSTNVPRPGATGPVQPAPDHSSGWQRFGEPHPTPTAAAGAPGNGWNSSGANGRSYAPPAASGARPQSIRIAPPIVRERTAPPPRSSSQSAPRSESSGSHPAPASHSSGGGSGSHGSGSSHR